jgi:hypothetical protein
MYHHDNCNVSRSLSSLMRKRAVWAPPLPIASASEAAALRHRAHETPALWSAHVATLHANPPT